MKKLNNMVFKHLKSEPTETTLSIIFLVIMVALFYFSMWGADVLGLLNN
jgi:hypothetical protein